MHTILLLGDSDSEDTDDDREEVDSPSFNRGKSECLCHCMLAPPQ